MLAHLSIFRIIIIDHAIEVFWPKTIDVGTTLPTAQQTVTDAHEDPRQDEWGWSDLEIGQKEEIRDHHNIDWGYM